MIAAPAAAALILLAGLAVAPPVSREGAPAATAPSSVLDFKATDIDGKEVPLSTYKGKVLLIVNTASRCGFTPQYEELQALETAYREKGFEVLAFPANEFGAQEPGTNAE